MEKAVAQGEVRLTGRALRLTAAFRKRLTAPAVATLVNETLPACNPCKAPLLAALAATALPAAAPAAAVRPTTHTHRTAMNKLRIVTVGISGGARPRGRFATPADFPPHD